MVSKERGKSLIKEIVKCYGFVEKNPQLFERRLLSEQDITTKFVLPMLRALNWDVSKITKEGPEVHEKAFKEKSDVGRGLPDIQLKSENGVVFVEIKKPPLGSQGMENLEKYEDADVIALTSFEDLKVYTRYEKRKPKLRFEANFKQYIEAFNELWNILSNTEKGKRTRAAYIATR